VALAHTVGWSERPASGPNHSSSLPESFDSVGEQRGQVEEREKGGIEGNDQRWAVREICI